LRGEVKSFLNEHADENGMMNAEDTATCERTEQGIDNFNAALDREERAERLERELNTPTSKVLSSRPEKLIIYQASGRFLLFTCQGLLHSG